MWKFLVVVLGICKLQERSLEVSSKNELNLVINQKHFFMLLVKAVIVLLSFCFLLLSQSLAHYCHRFETFHI